METNRQKFDLPHKARIAETVNKGRGPLERTAEQYKINQARLNTYKDSFEKLEKKFSIYFSKLFQDLMIDGASTDLLGRIADEMGTYGSLKNFKPFSEAVKKMKKVKNALGQLPDVKTSTHAKVRQQLASVYRRREPQPEETHQKTFSELMERMESFLLNSFVYEQREPDPMQIFTMGRKFDNDVNGLLKKCQEDMRAQKVSAGGPVKGLEPILPDGFLDEAPEGPVTFGPSPAYIRDRVVATSETPKKPKGND